MDKDKLLDNIDNYKKIRFSKLDFNTHFPKCRSIEYAGYVDILGDKLFYKECNPNKVSTQVCEDVYNKGIDFHTHNSGLVTPSFLDLILSFFSLNDESWIITPNTVNVLRPIVFKDYNFEIFGYLLKSLPKILKAEDSQKEFYSLILPTIQEAEEAWDIKIIKIEPDKKSFTINNHQAFTLLTSAAVGLESKLYRLSNLKNQVRTGKYQVIKRNREEEGMKYINYWRKYSRK